MDITKEVINVYTTWCERLYDTVKNKKHLRESEITFIEGQISILESIDKILNKYGVEI